MVSYVGGIKSSYGWHLYNAHGDVVQLANDFGQIIRSYDYDPFGNQLIDNSDCPNPYRYNNQYFDAETGYIYLRARYYDTTIGRFISEDPAFDGHNWYIYCGNNPIMYHDPTGLFIFTAAAAIILSATAISMWGSNISQLSENGGSWADIDVVKTAVDGGKAGAFTASMMLPGVREASALTTAAWAGTSWFSISCIGDSIQYGEVDYMQNLTEATWTASTAGIFKSFGSFLSNKPIKPTFKNNPSPYKTVEYKGHTVAQNNSLFDPNKLDSKGLSNIQRMNKGLAPIGYDGKSVNLHHINQLNNGPIVEVSQTYHQQNFGALHYNTGQLPSQINRAEFGCWRTDYWQWRATFF